MISLPLGKYFVKACRSVVTEINKLTEIANCLWLNTVYTLLVSIIIYVIYHFNHKDRINDSIERYILYIGTILFKILTKLNVSDKNSNSFSTRSSGKSFLFKLSCQYSFLSQYYSAVNCIFFGWTVIFLVDFNLSFLF